MNEEQTKECENRRAELKKILLDFHGARMDGKGFDFFFVISQRIDELTNLLNKK